MSFVYLRYAEAGLAAIHFFDPERFPLCSDDERRFWSVDIIVISTIGHLEQ